MELLKFVEKKRIKQKSKLYFKKQKLPKGV